MCKPIEVRVRVRKNQLTRITVVYEGVDNTAVHNINMDWREFLRLRGLMLVPRVRE